MPFHYYLCLVFFVACTHKPEHATNVPDSSHLIRFEQSIPLNVRGRIDHFAIDPIRNRLFVAALGNNTVEVIDLASRKRVMSIPGQDEPQGLQYVDDRLFVANGGTGKLVIYNATDLKQTGEIDLGDDADNIRFDSVRHRLFVGYGEGVIAIVDTRSLAVVARISLPAHPEALELEPDGNKVYVNVPGRAAIYAIDLVTNKIVATWHPGNAAGNFPLALDPSLHVLYAGCRSPASVVAIDTRTGSLKHQVSIASDADDIFLDPDKQHLFVSCGAGEIDVLDCHNPANLRVLERVETRVGARTAFLDRKSNKLFVALPEHDGAGSEVRIYRFEP